MFYCDHCKKEVLVYSLSHSKDSDKILDKLHRQTKAKGKLLLLNPNPMEPFRCPFCGSSLLSK